MDKIKEAISSAKKSTTEAERRAEEEQLFASTEAREEARSWGKKHKGDDT